MAVERFSSRTLALGDILSRRMLAGAQRYLRIAGYFRSSLLEVVGPALSDGREEIRVRVQRRSARILTMWKVARAAREGSAAVGTELSFRAGRPMSMASTFCTASRYGRLPALLSSGRMELRGSFHATPTTFLCMVKQGSSSTPTVGFIPSLAALTTAPPGSANAYEISLDRR